MCALVTIKRARSGHIQSRTVNVLSVKVGEFCVFANKCLVTGCWTSHKTVSNTNLKFCPLSVCECIARTIHLVMK